MDCELRAQQLNQTYSICVHVKCRKPVNSTSRKFNSIFTGLLPPCLICIRLIFNGSIPAKAIRGSPVPKKQNVIHDLWFKCIIKLLVQCWIKVNNYEKKMIFTSKEFF